jgi:hypothetical protein
VLFNLVGVCATTLLRLLLLAAHDTCRVLCEPNAVFIGMESAESSNHPHCAAALEGGELHVHHRSGRAVVEGGGANIYDSPVHSEHIQVTFIGRFMNPSSTTEAEPFIGRARLSSKAVSGWFGLEISSCSPSHPFHLGYALYATTITTMDDCVGMPTSNETAAKAVVLYAAVPNSLGIDA